LRIPRRARAEQAAGGEGAKRAVGLVGVAAALAAEQEGVDRIVATS
jgi:hypothetical protein